MEKDIQKTALEKLIAVDQDLRSFGFEWSNLDMILMQIASESMEVKDAIEKTSSKYHLQEEIGDLLHAAISLCLFVGFDVNETLEKAKNKLKARRDALKVLTNARGYNSLREQTIKYKLELWREAKKMVIVE